MDTTIDTFLANAREACLSVGDLCIYKAFLGAAMAICIYMVGESHIPLVGTLSVLVAIDFVTGIYSAWRANEPIESRKVVKTAVKWTLYMLMISAAHLTEALIPGDWFVAEVTIAYLGATELISILENIGRAGVAIPLKLLNKLEEFRRTQ